MAQPLHATVFLKKPPQAKSSPVIVLMGKVRFLKQAVLRQLCELLLEGEDGEMGLTRFAGKDAELKTITDELYTVSMWGDNRVVLVEDADPFVSQNRAALEKYVTKPSTRSVLILDVETWPKTTRLAKMVVEGGWTIECTELKGAALSRWVQEQAEQGHGKKMNSQAVDQLLQLAGTDLGQLDQEISKLAAYVGANSQITYDDVTKLVGGWKAETTWEMIAAIRDGKAGRALEMLNKLLVGGESPLMILGGISFTFRRLAQATELARQGRQLPAALKEAGVFPRDINSSASYLRRIGRPRAEKLYTVLLAADGNLKGNSTLPERIQLEQLVATLSGHC